MVQRFDLVSGYMQKWPEGEWVSYEDYAALASAHQALDADFQDYITTTEMELKELREKLGLSS